MKKKNQREKYQLGFFRAVIFFCVSSLSLRFYYFLLIKTTAFATTVQAAPLHVESFEAE